MDIFIKSNGFSKLSVKASGRLDLDNAVEYGTKIKDAIEDSNEQITDVILDFTDITFISSFGLKVILELYKQLKEQGGTLKLICVSNELRSTFKMVGFDKFLAIE